MRCVVLFFLTLLMVRKKNGKNYCYKISFHFKFILSLKKLNSVNYSMLLFLTVLIFSSKKIYKDLTKAETVSSKVVLFIVEGISSLRIIIIEINPCTAENRA
ncbi:hypothetical protein SAMN05421664_2546 [Chryseobacterium soldanellicola]|uniref:Uncharacterized protein n=1 Tax=Chryseobacterium soldanellicola TaxID=311333 RepID=A0A1H1DMC1_9FLAO|nr:hypothetical protein SAMN05421664_2546 [Chryseobacterium soldanellicola]